MGIAIYHMEEPIPYAIQSDKYAPTGDVNVEYPQLCIRTNRTPERTDIEEVVDAANKVADQFPIEDKENRAKAVTEALTKIFGSGSFGHTWILFFNSNNQGDSTTYGYHEGYGYVKNGTGSGTNDSPERKFHVQHCVPLSNPDKQPAQLEKTVIPALNKASADIANIMGIPVPDPSKGAYTPINNCAWFAGNLWNYATDEQFIYEQEFNGAAHADYWGMPFLNAVETISDPGMVAETINGL
ncbi:hypothetical protein [Aeromonas sp. CA23]|uniref:hypothetical protein n=1 Tax=Aeromonas sp. CA23 TaxID=2033032 RepID=UPI001C129C1E|nr:hypothetical protein [Aeromonas sp. CA23]